MGLLDNQTQFGYYNNQSNYGGYQFVTLEHIISAFKVAYIGEGKIISKANVTDIQFAIQQDGDGNYVFYDSSPNVDEPTLNAPDALMEQGSSSEPNPDYTYVVEQPNGDPTLITNVDINDTFNSNTLNSFNSQSGTSASDDTSDILLDANGRRYGIDPQYAQNNGSFYIDTLRGFIHFGSSLAGQTITLKYVSDGLGTDAEMVVHKFCEEACYKHIMYGLLSTRSNIPESIVLRYKKERFAETRKAKIRLSNIKMEEFTQILKGLSKQIK